MNEARRQEAGPEADADTAPAAVPAPVATLKKRAQFLALRKAPRFHDRAFILQGHVSPRGEGDPPLRAGYTVTRKTGNAVERNRIRRRLRNALARALAASAGSHGGEIVLIAQREVLDERFDTLICKITKGIDRLASKGNKAGRGLNGQ